jgi:hypothetical protein
MAKKNGQGKPCTGRNRLNERINGAEAGRCSVPSYRGELGAKFEVRHGAWLQIIVSGPAHSTPPAPGPWTKRSWQ